MVEFKIDEVRWFVVINDVVGGWSVSNVDKPLSEQDHSKGEFELFECWDKDSAQYIVALHHNLHRSRFPEQHRV